jgi:2,4-dienoyl-CoA reductase-like NADH-dependent reductase (Old Yellow Enzyme family)
MPMLFDPLTLKGVTLRNRIAVSPMCQYMADGGRPTDWHRVHYPSLARGGAGLVVVEATAVSPEGRITWGDTGLWSEAQGRDFASIAASIVEGGSVPGVQIGHAGPKASANRPWEGDDHLPDSDPRGWPTIGPSAIAPGGGLSKAPRAMTHEDIARVTRDFVAAAERARDAGYRWLVLHYAHGYLAQSFWSVHANRRDDAYGGSAENRGRFLMETLAAVRRVWPEDRVLSARLGAIEFDGRDEETLAESIALLRRMKAAGLDFVDVSMGFTAKSSTIPWGPNMLVPTAARVRRESGLPTATSWFISDAKQADAFVREGQLDAVMLARPMLENPHWPYAAAKQLGVERAAWNTLPAPYAHWLARYR